MIAFSQEAGRTETRGELSSSLCSFMSADEEDEEVRVGKGGGVGMEGEEKEGRRGLFFSLLFSLLLFSSTCSSISTSCKT